MNSQYNDRQFDENLKAVGQHTSVPAGVSADVYEQCLATLSDGGPSMKLRRRKSGIFSALSMAACLALVFGMFFPWGNGRSARAAVILAKLNEQIQGSRMISMTLDNLVVEEASINGSIHLSDLGLAGDVKVSVNDDEGQVNVDVAFGLSEEHGWVLIRNLEIPDKDAQALLSLFLVPGTETLILLPEDALMGENFGVELDEVLVKVSSGKVAGLLSAIIGSHVKVGATITDQADGTVLLQLPFDDEEAIQALLEVVIESGVAGEMMLGTPIGPDKLNEIKAEIRAEISSDDDVKALIGSELSVVYDPNTETVNSFSLDNIGAGHGRVSISIGSGLPDPTMLDAASVTTPSTRTFDLDALQSMFGNMKFDH